MATRSKLNAAANPNNPAERALTDDQIEKVKAIFAKLRDLERKDTKAAIAKGRYLFQIKTIFEGRGEWLRICKSELSWGYHQCQRLIRIYEVFEEREGDEEALSIMLTMSPTALGHLTREQAARAALDRAIRHVEKHGKLSVSQAMAYAAGFTENKAQQYGKVIVAFDRHLYDHRSTAAHTSKEIDSGPVAGTYVYLRNALVRMVDENKVPSQDDLGHFCLCSRSRRSRSFVMPLCLILRPTRKSYL